MEYTTTTYWENYYSNSRVNRQHIEWVCSHYDAFWDQWIGACDQRPRSIIEIGAYPGRYIAYIAARYGLDATALDYNPDRTKIEQAFQSVGVVKYEIIQADFLKYEPHRQYDLVFSNGFIEHFEHYNEILNRHSDYLAPGGAMLVMIPNTRYLRKWYGWMVDFDNLKAHNLKCMNLGTFHKFASNNQLKIHHLSYFGGFAYRVHQSLNLPQRLLYKVVRWISLKLNPVLAKYPGKYHSGTIVAIFSKPIE